MVLSGLYSVAKAMIWKFTTCNYTFICFASCVEQQIMLYISNWLTDPNDQKVDCVTRIEPSQIKNSERYVNSLDDCLYTEDDQKYYHVECCVACESGQVVDSKTNSCIDCQAGHKCPSTLQTLPSRKLNEPCPPGTFQPDTKQTNCIDCPKGKECESRGLTRFNECPLGYNCQD